jgi:hypothetical protein
MCTPLFQNYGTLYFSIYLTLPLSFIFLNAFMLLFNILLFQFEKKTHFRISYKADLVVKNSLDFYVYEEIVIFLSFLKDGVSRCDILCCHLFFSHFAYIIPFPLDLRCVY